MSEVDDETAPLGSLGTSDEGGSSGESVAAGPLLQQLEQEDALEPLAADEPLEASRIRARRRPRAVLLLWAWELFGAILLAAVVHAWARKVWGEHPDGDAVLFRPGGRELLSWLDDPGPALSIVVRSTLLGFVVLAVAGQVVTATVIASLAMGRGEHGSPPRMSRSLGVGVSAFFSMLTIGAVTLATQAFVLGLGAILSEALGTSLTPSLGDARATTAHGVAFGLFAAVAALAGVSADLVRVSVVREIACAEAAPRKPAIRDSVTRAFHAMRHVLGRAAFAWGWRAALSLGLVYAGARAADAVGGRGGAMLWLLFAFHQAVILGRAALRTSWLANALRLVTR